MKKILTITIILLFNSIAYAGWFSSEGKIRISSNYEGAEIFVDGIKKAETGNGYTTLTVPEGDRIIRVFKRYDKWIYLEAEKRIYVGKDTVNDLSMRLRQKLTNAGIERKLKKDKQLQYEKELYNSKNYKKYVNECQYCKRKRDALIYIERSLYKNAIETQTVSSLKHYIDNCINCYEKYLQHVNKLLPQVSEFERTYNDNDDGTVTDKNTGLMWMRCSIESNWESNKCKEQNNAKFDEPRYNKTFPGVFKWSGKDLIINTFNTDGGYAGYKDWRIPTIKELSSLITKCKPKIKEKILCSNLKEYSIEFSNNIIAIPLISTTGSYKHYWATTANNSVAAIQFYRRGSIRYGIHKNNMFKTEFYGRFLLVRNSEVKNTPEKQKEIADEKTLYELVKSGDTSEITYEYLSTCKHCIHRREVEKKYYEFADAMMGAMPQDYLDVCKICEYKDKLKNKFKHMFK